jgi:hypothetical protein
VGLSLLGLTLVSVVGYVLFIEDRYAGLEAAPSSMEPLLDLTRAPKFVFPVESRSFDPTLNQFIDHFARVCLDGRYSEFRLLYTRRLDPPPSRHFVSMFNAVREIRVIALEKLPPIPTIEGPVYRLEAEYELEDYAVKESPRKRLHVAVIQEDGAWVIAPLPRGSAELLEEILTGTTRPAAGAEDSL